MPAEVIGVLALNWILLAAVSVWLLRRSSALDRRLEELGGRQD